MKIAIIDHILNPGGGTRVARSLLPAMKRVQPDLDITFFANEHGLRRDHLQPILDAHQIKVVPLRSVKFSGKDFLGVRGSRHAVGLLQRKLLKFRRFLPVYVSGDVKKELEHVIKGFDYAFFTWPFHLECPKLSCPMAGIFHDFNYKYYFSANAMLHSVFQFLEDNIPIWLEHSTPIVSTQFMKSEIKKFYPQFAHKVRVVEIAPMSDMSNLEPEDARRITATLPVPKNYILCPTHMCGHKNVGPLLSAHALLRKKGYQGGLVFTGAGTEVLNGKACLIGLEKKLDLQDVFGLGYISNEQIDALIQCADVLVNPSLYEGGCGPGFDAWARGVPVAMSNIPPFLEHMRAHDVRAEIFDPRSPEDIAEKILSILKNPSKIQEDVAYSQKAISHFTWERSAKGYLDVFEEVLRGFGVNLSSKEE